MKNRMICFLCILVLCLSVIMPVCRVQAAGERLVDSADLLSDGEEAELLDLLNEISERQQFDVVIVTVDSLDGKTAMAYADDYYDYNGYGYGADGDGVLLLISMENRDYWISTKGYGITALTDAGIEYISEQFLPDLSDGYYADAFRTYAKLCDDFVTQAKTGEPYDWNNMPRSSMSPIWIFISVAAGAVISFLVCSTMKSELKSVRQKNTASSYVRVGSMQVNVQSDRFLYRQVISTPKPEEKSSGSSTHTSSSGSTHGGGGGKF
ncbi:MAG: TPM domain-containing protein [Lachnospiraceae bacterium]